MPMPSASRYSPLAYGLIWAMVCGGIDQTTKWAVVHFLALPTGKPHAILPFMDFTLIWNYGISYGWFATSGGGGQWLLITLTLAICGFLLWILKATDTRLGQCGYGLIIGGALGNLVDRLVYGAVVDFISLHAAGFYWYVFNVADIWISFGLIALAIDAWRSRKL